VEIQTFPGFGYYLAYSGGKDDGCQMKIDFGNN